MGARCSPLSPNLSGRDSLAHSRRGEWIAHRHFQLAAPITILLCCALFIAGCTAISASSTVRRIALLAPFEGRYREIGYNALYAARLALADYGNAAIELLAVDDGGTVETAALHMQAVAQDPSIIAIIGLGYDAAHTLTQEAVGDLPYLIVGNWAEERAAENVYILSSSAINSAITIPATTAITEAAQLPAPFSGGEIIGLEGFARLREDLSEITLITSGTLPDTGFRERYISSDLYVPEPNHLATLIYDTLNFILSAEAANRADATNLMNVTYSGINGEISFVDGWWASAPVYRYEYSADGRLAPAG